MAEAKSQEAKQSVPLIGVFDAPDQAEQAYDVLLEEGYTSDEITVLMSAETRKQFKSGNPVAASATGTEVEHASDKVLGGAGAISAAGALSGLVVGAGALIAVPGLGLLVAGPLAALGASLGAALGAMYGIPFTEMKGNNVADYESQLRSGKVLLSIEPRSQQERERIEQRWDGISKARGEG